jgi:hypothetical protein
MIEQMNRWFYVCFLIFSTAVWYVLNSIAKNNSLSLGVFNNELLYSTNIVVWNLVFFIRLKTGYWKRAALAISVLLITYMLLVGTAWLAFMICTKYKICGNVNLGSSEFKNVVLLLIILFHIATIILWELCYRTFNEKVKSN